MLFSSVANPRYLCWSLVSAALALNLALLGIAKKWAALRFSITSADLRFNIPDGSHQWIQGEVSGRHAVPTSRLQLVEPTCQN